MYITPCQKIRTDKYQILFRAVPHHNRELPIAHWRHSQLSPHCITIFNKNWDDRLLSYMQPYISAHWLKQFSLKINLPFSIPTWFTCQSWRPRGLKRRSAAARLLELWVRIPPEEWTFFCCECCVLSGRGLCDELINRSEESYWLWCVVVCDLETSWMRRPWLTGGYSAKNKQMCLRIFKSPAVCRVLVVTVSADSEDR